MALRARVMLLADKGWPTEVIARQLDMDPNLPASGVAAGACRRRRPRWVTPPGPGGPASFTPVQIAQVEAVACTPPKDCGLPLSRWSCPEIGPPRRGDRDLPVDRPVDGAPVAVRRWA